MLVILMRHGKAVMELQGLAWTLGSGTLSLKCHFKADGNTHFSTFGNNHRNGESMSASDVRVPAGICRPPVSLQHKYELILRSPCLANSIWKLISRRQ